MKSVIISIQPKWCGLIAGGKKTIEVRKTKPKLKPPFKCYIYCTKGRNHFWVGKQYSYADERSHNAFDKDGNGKVIGEFTCGAFILDRTYGHDPLLYGAACMNAVDVAAYALNNPVYGWHISGLKIYDEPKELSAFTTKCHENCEIGCYSCEYYHLEEYGVEYCGVDGFKPLKRPPQSWHYVEEK